METHSTATSNPTPAPAAKTRANGRKTARRRRSYLGWIALAVLVIVLVVALLPKPLAVEEGVVSQGPLTVSVLEEGKTRIRNRYVISPPVTGLLRRTSLRPGDKLEAGKTIVASLETQPSGFLDPRTHAQTEAAVAASEANVELRQAEQARAQTALDLAMRERERARKLKNDGTISEQEWDQTDVTATLRQRELRAAEFTAKVAQFELDQARAALLQVQQPGQGGGHLFEIRSPVDGVVLNVYEESSRIVSPGTPLMEVGDPRDLEVEVELLSQDAVSVHPGGELMIEQWGGEKPLRGRVSMVEPAAYTKISALGVEEQRVKVRAEFVDLPPPDHPLGDRFRIEARVITWQANTVLRIPTGSLFRRGGEWMTFLVKDGHAHLTTVKIGHNSGVYAEVLEGVSDGQVVVVHPPDVVVDGMAIRQRKTDGP